MALSARSNAPSIELVLAPGEAIAHGQAEGAIAEQCMGLPYRVLVEGLVTGPAGWEKVEMAD